MRSEFDFSGRLKRNAVGLRIRLESPGTLYKKDVSEKYLNSSCSHPSPSSSEHPSKGHTLGAQRG